jgi:hypothetical protein
MPRTITILAPMAGRSLDDTLNYALDLLSANSLAVAASAEVVNSDTSACARILLRFLDAKPQALQLLAKAGIQTET